MTLSELLLSEFEEEMTNTRKILECLPDDRFEWQPHEKSFTLGRLANHVCELVLYASVLIRGMGKKTGDATTRADLMALFEERVTAAREAIAGTTDEFLLERVAVTTPFAGPRVTLFRKRVMNHLIHHRGQLSVYLRLLDVAVPGMYGPSADDKLLMAQGAHGVDPSGAASGQASGK